MASSRVFFPASSSSGFERAKFSKLKVKKDLKKKKKEFSFGAFYVTVFEEVAISALLDESSMG